MNNRISTYRVYYKLEDNFEDVYMQHVSPQKLVDFLRKDNPDIEIIEVSKVIHNWR